MKKITLLMALAISFSAFAQSDVLIAHYPLASTPNDTTGQSDPMVLVNTPFLEGGIYCNGIYELSGLPDWCQAETPMLPASIFESLTLSAKFKVESLGVPPSNPITNVLAGGRDLRWLSFILMEDTTVAFKYNMFEYKTSSLHFTMNTWHEFKITYNNIDTTVNLFLDDVFACSVQAELIHGIQFDRTIGITDWSTGGTFKGFLKDLKIYTRAPISGIDSQSEYNSFRLFPNPNNGRFNLEINNKSGNKIDLEIYNLIGEKVFIIEDFNPQTSNEIDLSGFHQGIYFLRFYDGLKIQTEKIVLQ